VKRLKPPLLPPQKDLRKLIIPLIIEQILAIAVGMADTIMVSAAGGRGSVANNKICHADLHASSLFFFPRKCPETTALACVISVIFITAHDPLLRLMFGKIEDDVMKASKTYLIITTYSFVALAIYIWNINKKITTAATYLEMVVGIATPATPMCKP